MQLSQTHVLELLANVIYNWRNRFMNTVMISTKIIWLQRDSIQLKNARLHEKVVNKLLLLILAVVKVPTGKLIKIHILIRKLNGNGSQK